MGKYQCGLLKFIRLSLSDRICKFYKKSAFISLKAHKINFKNNFQNRLLNSIKNMVA